MQPLHAINAAARILSASFQLFSATTKAVLQQEAAVPAEAAQVDLVPAAVIEV